MDSLNPRASNPVVAGSVPVATPSLLALGERRFAVRRKLVHVALQAHPPVAAGLVGGAELLEIASAGLAHTHMPTFAACLSAAARMGFAAHSGQAKQGDEEDGGFSHGTWLKRVGGTTSVAARGSKLWRRLDALRVAINRGLPPDGTLSASLGKYKFKCYFKAIGGLFRLPWFNSAG